VWTKQIFFYLFHLIELNENNSQASRYCRELIGNGFGMQLNEMLDHYPILTKTMADIFVTPILGGEVFGGKKPKLDHRHDDYAKPQPHLENPEECSCSILEIIIRYSTTLSSEDEEDSQMGELLMKLSTYKPFKVYYCLASFRMYRFYFRVDFTPATVKIPGSPKCGVSGLLNQFFQLIGSAEYSLLAARGYDVAKFFESVAYILEKFVELRDYTRSVYEMPSTVMSTLFEWVCLKDAVTEIILTPGYIPGFINCIKILQASRFQYKVADQEILGDEQINKVIKQVRFESEILNKIRGELCMEYRNAFHKKGNDNEKMLLAIMRECVIQNLDLRKEEQLSSIDFEYRESFAALERIFVLTATNFLYLTYQSDKLVQSDIDMGRLELMNESVFTDETQKQDFYISLAVTLARVSGLVRQANKSGIWVSSFVLT
jgi:hypothetical protein